MGGWIHSRDTRAALVECAEFKCERLYPKLDAATESAFKEIDALLAAQRGSNSPEELAEFIGAGARDEPIEALYLMQASHSLRLLNALPTVGIPSLGDIAMANRILCGEDKRLSPWRTTPVWIGHVAVERSVWVGASPREIPSLMSRWRGVMLRSAPVSLRLAVAMLRLLQIHPFPDGNGRTTRWVAVSAARASPLLTCGLERLTMDVWAAGAAFRQAASAGVSQDDDWSMWFDEWIRCARGSA
jgi:hypothetical protein